MDFITLGSTGITTNKNGFGALPVQRLTVDDAVYLLKKAYDNGITFFDTANAYTDSEKKIGLALAGVRDKIYIATKTMGNDVDGFWKQLHNSLKMMKTDYVDVYQFHNPGYCPKPGDESGLYDAMLEAKKQGKIRHIGITNHKLAVAVEAAESGLYEMIQYPMSYLASDDELDFVEKCKEKNIGVLAMKALAGGLVSSAKAAYAFLMQLENVLPIWGVQRESELDEFISYQTNPPIPDAELRAVIERDKQELSGEFCRCCGYCMPCTVGIEINQAARMIQLVRRAPESMWRTDNCRENMKLIESCTNCNRCKEKCPYGLDIPNLLRKNWEDYKTFM